MNKKKLFRTAFIFIFLAALVGFACEIPGLPGEGVPTQDPGEPEPPPVEPTAPPVEPTSPPVVEPTAPGGGEVAPPDGDDGGSSDSLIQVLFWLLVIVVVILGVALIVSLFTGRRKESPPAPAPTPEQSTSYAETPEPDTGPQPVPGTPTASVLDSISPQVAPIYDRFVNLVQGLGPVTILPTQTRVDFQRRIIFASTQFSQDAMRVQLLLPQRVDDPRMVRIEVYSEDKVAHSLVMRSVDDFDAKFTSWLGDAYKLGG